MSDDTCVFFDFGDRVRSVINPHLSGLVIGERQWGDEYLVRLADGASTIWWHSIEIELDPDAPTPDGSKEDDDTNVVRFDLTKRRPASAQSIMDGVA